LYNSGTLILMLQHVLLFT